MRRRAVVFSLITITLAAFFILMFWGTTAPRIDANAPAVESRVSGLDRYIASWDAYTQDAARLSVRGALIEMSNQMGPATPVSSPKAMERNISSCLLTGQTNLGAGTFYCFPGGINNSLTARLNAFADLASKELSIDTAYVLDPNITVEDWGPFELRVGFGVNYTVKDEAATTFARWNRSRRYDVLVSVEGLPDPLFARRGSTYMLPAYQRRNITKFAVPRDRFTQTNISNLVASRAYIENRGSAPTYLQRLAGNLSSPDPLNLSGIETLIHPSESNIAPGLRMNRSFTDHQVFGNKAFACWNETVRIKGPAPFSTLYLDHGHWTKYRQNATNFNFTCS